MSPRVIFKKDELESLLRSESLTSRILTDIVTNYKILDGRFDMIGIANNVLLGVFGLNYENDNGYRCYRLYYENDRLIFATKGYPVTNMGGKFDIDCVIDYVISIKTIQNLSNSLLKSAI